MIKEREREYQRSTIPKKGISRIAIGRRVRWRTHVPRVALYCGLSRFRNFALWCRLGRTNEQGRLEAGRVALDVRGWIGKGGAEVLPDSEYDHSLRPPRPKIAHTPLVFTQRHRLATCRFVDRSETDENCEGERKERERERENER